MATLDQLPIGKTALQTTSIGLGTVPLAGFGGEVSYADFERTILAAYGLGVRHFDCAPDYGAGKSELFLGHALRTQNLRDKIVLSSKVGRILKPATLAGQPTQTASGHWVASLPFYVEYDYSYDGIMRSFEDTQHRLGMEFLDIVMVHDIGRAWHGDKNDGYMAQLRGSGYKALDELRSKGHVKAVGLGVNETEIVVEISAEFPLDCALIAGRYSLLNHAPLRGAFPVLQERGVSIIAAGVFNSGILALGTRAGGTYDYGNAPAEIVEKVRRIEEVCDRHGVSLPTAAMQFVYANPAVAEVLVGAKTVAQMEHNVQAISQQVPAEFWQDMKDGGLIPEEAPTPA